MKRSMEGLHPPRSAAIVGLTIGLMLGSVAVGATGSARGVSVWLPKETLPAKMGLVKTQEWRAVPLDDLPRSVRGNPVMASETVLASFEAETGAVGLYSRVGDRLQKRGVAVLEPTCRPATYRLVPGDARTGPGVEIHAPSRKGSAQTKPACTVYLNQAGIFEFRPGRSARLTIKDSQLAYGIVPSYVGVDLVFDPRDHVDADRLHVPSMNLFVGLVAGGDCMMVATWPAGDQSTKLGLTTEGARRTIGRFTIDPSGGSVYLSYLTCPGIWHAEELKDTHLERDTEIGWKRPFDARWIGRFFIGPERIHYPFYFRHGKKKVWGRCIRGWYHYPLWFEKDKTTIHFEKKFPPEGELLIYHLERQSAPAPDSTGVLSPVAVMRRALGADVADKLLDLDGIEPRAVLEHGNAVCAMTDQLTQIFKAGQEVKERSKVTRLADDVATFITRIRERAYEFDEFARRLKAFLKAQTLTDPTFSREAFAVIIRRITEIERLLKGAMPRVSLEEVRGWTDQIKALSSEVREGNKEKCIALGFKCRSIASTQDDLVRGLSIRAIGIMEAAARAGVVSPERVKLAERIIVDARRVLRHPTCWEPSRANVPKADPGRD